jgi:hypothetical protein
MLLDWDARAVISNLKTKAAPDGRYRPDTVKGQMQRIYFNLKENNERATERKLVTLWKKHYEKDHELYELKESYRKLLNQQKCIKRRLRETEIAIKRRMQ